MLDYCLELVIMRYHVFQKPNSLYIFILIFQQVRILNRLMYIIDNMHNCTLLIGPETSYFYANWQTNAHIFIESKYGLILITTWSLLMRIYIQFDIATLFYSKMKILLIAQMLLVSASLFTIRKRLKNDLKFISQKG